MNNNIKQLIKNIIRIIFSLLFQFSLFFIFKENKDNLDIKSIDRRIDVIIRNLTEYMNCILFIGFLIITKEAIKIATAGVGNPIKEESCFLSILNLANLIAEKRVMINPM